LIFGDLDDPNSSISAAILVQEAAVLHPEYKTDPSVYYTELPQTFLAGSVMGSDTSDYINGATVTLTDTQGDTWTIVTNEFGDFLFDGLTAGQTYTLAVSATGYTAIQKTVTLSTDTNLGQLQLSKSS
jgi:hypothetical protein